MSPRSNACLRPIGTASRLLAAASLALGCAAAVAASQAPAAAVVSTSTGVYTSAQAARGEQTYMTSCVSCHPQGTYAVPTFREKWNGHPLSDLFALIRTTMPKEEPGTLEPAEYAEVLAYLLKINGMPPGKVELPADAKALRRIRFSPAGPK